MKKVTSLVLIAFCVAAMSMAAMAGTKTMTITKTITKGVSTTEATKVVKVKKVKRVVKKVHVKTAPVTAVPAK